MKTRGRVESVDFWRGVVLLIILINHTPYSLFDYVTPRNYGFSDSAEAFVFLSGFAFAFAYWPRFEAGQTGTVIWRCVRRALQLYGVHIALTLAAVAMFGLAAYVDGPSELIQNILFFTDPRRATEGTLTLGYQIGFFNILPLYVVVMLLAGVLMLLLRRSVWLALGASLALYVVARFGLELPSWPEPDSWFFNSFAWQLIFAIGMACGVLAHGKGIPYRRPVFIAACVVLVLSALTITGVFGLRQDVAEWGWTYLDAGKHDLGVVRLVHFLALAYVLSNLRLGEAALRLPGSSEISRLGRWSLPIFAAGSLISALGQITTIVLTSRGASEETLLSAGVAVVVMGTAALIAMARLLDLPSPVRPQRILSTHGAPPGLPLSS